jgi:hypothetical protein
MPSKEWSRVHISTCNHKLHELMNADETVLRLEKGKTRYGRQTFVYFKAYAGTFAHNTGNEPGQIRSWVFELNVDQPDTARIVDEGSWEPLAY